MTEEDELAREPGKDKQTVEVLSSEVGSPESTTSGGRGTEQRLLLWAKDSNDKGEPCSVPGSPQPEPACVGGARRSWEAPAAVSLLLHEHLTWSNTPFAITETLT